MSYSETRKELAEKVGNSFLPCHVCGKATLTETLSQYGARCFACYGIYCSTPPDIPKKRQLAASIAAMK